MKSEAARTWLRLGADLTVVLGIILLAIQVRQNTKAVVAANSTAVADQSLAFFEAGLDNQVVATAIQKHSSGQQITALERSQLARLQYLNFRGFEHAYLQYRAGYYPKNEWLRYRRIIARILAEDSIARMELARIKGWGFTIEFERELDRIQSGQ